MFGGNKKKQLAIIALALYCLAIDANSAVVHPVYSVTYQGETQSSDGRIAVRVLVKCNAHNDQRYIFRTQGQNQWCAYAQDSLCDEDRIEAAAIACRLESSEVAAFENIRSSSTARSATLNQAEQQRIVEIQALENELLSIQQKKLEIRKRQLELRRREMELVNQRDGVN